MDADVVLVVHMNAVVDNDVEERDDAVQSRGVLHNLYVVASRTKRPFRLLLPPQKRRRPMMMGEHLHDKIRRSKFEDR